MLVTVTALEALRCQLAQCLADTEEALEVGGGSTLVDARTHGNSDSALGFIAGRLMAIGSRHWGRSRLIYSAPPSVDVVFWDRVGV